MVEPPRIEKNEYAGFFEVDKSVIKFRSSAENEEEMPETTAERKRAEVI